MGEFETRLYNRQGENSMSHGAIGRRTLLNGAALAVLSATLGAREGRAQQAAVPNSIRRLIDKGRTW